ncbi:MAG: hypothetical protein ACKODB_07020 [Betaproteobacteria bacterium]
MPQVIPFAELRSRGGTATVIGLGRDENFERLARAGMADVAVVSTENGFSPLGQSIRFFAADLGVDRDQISRLANWNRFENPRVTLVAIPSARQGSLLRGAILAPGNNCVSYRPYFARRPNRDYYYNVAYEAIHLACVEWGARKVAISHLSGCGYHEDMATCTGEALAHFCDAQPEYAPESLAFCSCCIEQDHLKGMERLNDERHYTYHRPIPIEREVRQRSTLVHLEWPRKDHLDE